MDSHSLDLYVTRSRPAGICAPHPRGVDVAALEEGPACFSVHVKALGPGALCVKGCACAI